jgi:GLPGLI family protein
MKKIFFVLLILSNTFTFAQQNTAGQILFERTVVWSKLVNRSTHLSKEEKDRISETWKNDPEYKIKMILSFSNNASHYTHENEMQFSEDGTYSWKNDDFIILRNFDKNNTYEVQQMLGKRYILEDSLYALNWKILNEIKEVAGYICMKATAYDSVKRQGIIAWFSTDLPISTGPERYFGLPGTILEIATNDEAVLLTATKITINKAQLLPSLPKKVKGKKLTESLYNKMIIDYITQQEKMHEFAWGLRY